MLTELETSRPSNSVIVVCRDVARRRREVVVSRLPDGRVMVAMPPGEVAVFELEEAEVLWGGLRAAAPHVAVRPTPAVAVCVSFAGTVRCSDAMDRERAVTVATRRGGRVAVAAPPGGVAIFCPRQVTPFGTALREAIGAARLEAVTA